METNDLVAVNFISNVQTVIFCVYFESWNKIVVSVKLFRLSNMNDRHER